MTIKIIGHVEKMECGTKTDGARICIRLESSRSRDVLFEVEAAKGEWETYGPGTPVEITIIPQRTRHG